MATLITPWVEVVSLHPGVISDNFRNTNNTALLLNPANEIHSNT